MAFLTSPLQATGSDAPQNTSSALALQVLQQGPLIPTIVYSGPETFGGRALTLRGDGRLQAGTAIAPGTRYLALVPDLAAGDGDLMVGD